MSFFTKTKKFIKESYEKGADFSNDINKIKQKSHAEKIKVLKQKNVIAKQQTQLAQQKALQNKYKQQSGSGSLFGMPGSSQAQSNALFGNDFNPGAGLSKVLGNPPKPPKKRQGKHNQWL